VLIYGQTDKNCLRRFCFLLTALLSQLQLPFNCLDLLGNLHVIERYQLLPYEHYFKKLSFVKRLGVPIEKGATVSANVVLMLRMLRRKSVLCLYRICLLDTDSFALRIAPTYATVANSSDRACLIAPNKKSN